jgi:hypothetical protein
MGAACPIIGTAVFAKFSLMDPRVLIATGLLSGTLFAGAMIIALVNRWRKRQENQTLTTHDNLAAFRVLYERGELSAEEFERIKKQLLGRLKQDLAAPSKEARPAAAAIKSASVSPLPPLPDENSTAITDAAATPLPPLPSEPKIDQSSDQ